MSERLYTTKQMGDAGEMLVAAELTLHGIPALKVPDNWPHYDIIAQPPDNWSGYRTDARPPQTISVKTRTFARSGNFVGYGNDNKFDWLAVVILPGEGLDARRIFIVPRPVADLRSYAAEPRLIEQPPSPFPTGEPAQGRGWGLADYENNFGLLGEPTNGSARPVPLMNPLIFNWHNTMSELAMTLRGRRLLLVVVRVNSVRKPSRLARVVDVGAWSMGADPTALK